MTKELNTLDWLIPTGEYDIAVRELLVPIFGRAMSCKVPGAPCPAPGDVTSPIANSGSLLEGIFSVFNAGTLAFATVILIFIGILGFVKTAQDGEFFGRSWNTTFTALRLVAGVAFILPMPNNYSSIQNFVMYVGLWSSGFANGVNTTITEHYLHRLYLNMVNAEPGAVSVSADAPEVLKMHICASYLNRRYPEANATMMIKSGGTGPADRFEYAYVQHGPGPFARLSAPCGRITIEPASGWYHNVTTTSGVPGDAWGPAFWGSQPLTANARQLMMQSLSEIGTNARQAKIDAIDDLARQTSVLRGLADRIVVEYDASNIQFDAEGKIASPGAARTPDQAAAFGTQVIADLATIVNNANIALNDKLTHHRTEVMESARAEGGAFFAQMKDMLQKGGWMGAAATYRTMLDMVSVTFRGEQQSPYKIEARDEAETLRNVGSAGGFARQLATLTLGTDRLLLSDVAKGISTTINGPAASDATSIPHVSQASIEKIATAKLNTNAALELIYGTTWYNSMRHTLVKKLAISGDYDPLFQVKSIGDSAALLSELLVTHELTARSAIAVAQTAERAAGATAAGWVADKATGGVTAIDSAIEGAKYVLDEVFALTRSLAFMLAGIAFLFSTWLPAIPFVAFLLAQLGWLFGLIMTLFAVNIWGVMHITPARNDSFIGSEAQGYLLIVALFFRPAIATSALAVSYVVASPVMKLINLTLLPAIYATNVSTNSLSIVLMTMFGLVLYFIVAKGALTMVYMLPQSFPDEVLRVVSAGIGDLGQTRALSTLEGGADSGNRVTADARDRLKGAHIEFLGRAPRKSAEQMPASPDRGSISGAAQ